MPSWTAKQLDVKVEMKHTFNKKVPANIRSHTTRRVWYFGRKYEFMKSNKVPNGAP